MKTVPSDTHSSHRVKVGMIGLAAVLLLIGFASAIFTTVNHDRPVEIAGGGHAAVIANIAGDPATPSDAASPNEPLAELGVAPSTTDTNAAAVTSSSAK